MAFGILALIVASMFTGAAIYVSLVEHPARAVLTVNAQVEAWKPSYARSSAMRATLAILGFALGVIASWQTRDLRWMGGSVLLVASWPFTVIMLVPTNRILRALYPGQASLESQALLERWGRLHAARTVFGVASVAVFAWAAISPNPLIALHLR
jgi:Domain of unknown function (DUF1772)